MMLSLVFRSKGDTPFIVDVWGTADGLPQSSVIALTQTRDGYLWLGTLNGLVRFDGKSFTRFNVNNTPVNNTPGVPSDRVVFLFEDSRTNLWVGTETAGLCCVRNGVLQTFDTGGAGGKITAAFEDDGGAIWFGMDGGKFFCWKDGKLDLQPSVFPSQLFYRTAHFFVPGKNGVVWQLQNGRVEKWRNGQPEKDYGLCPWTNTPVSAAIEDAHGDLVVGTLGAGVFYFEVTGNTHHIDTEHGLSHNFILSLCSDSEGDLWVGTDTGGLDRLRRKIFMSPPGLGTGVAQSVSEDTNGGIWTTFNLRGLTYLRTNSPQHFGIGRESKSWPVLADHQGRVWAGTSGEGLFCFMSYYFRPVSEAAIIGAQISALFESRDGNVWVGGEKGAGCFDGKSWKFFNTRNGLAKNAVRAFAQTADDILWLGTQGGGLFMVRDGKVLPSAAPMKDVSCLLADQEGVLWVGTSGHGLAWLDHGQWTNCSTLNGLAADSIGYLAEDATGGLWLGSYEGLLRVEKKSLADFAAGRNKTVSCRTFLTRECTVGAQPAAIRTQAGQLLFPTIEGVVALDPANLKSNQKPPPVVIESVLVDGVEQKKAPLSSNWPDDITLTPENEQLEIHFTSLNFSAPKRATFGAQFRYQLEGRDKKPTDTGGERVAHLTRLLPGQYVLRVTACNEDGVWNKTGATLRVNVLPPFWRTAWFLAASLLFFLSALVGAIYLISTAKLKRQLRAAHQKEMIEHERARSARDLHDQLGANLTQVTLLGEMAEADKDLPGEVEQHAQQICATARETTRSLDEIVWAVNPSNDTLEGLANYACKYAQDYFALAGISFRSELPAVPPTPILPEVRHNVFLAFKEAVNNVVKHAQATEARVKLQVLPGKFILSIADNGCGLGDLTDKKLRNGLKNMRRRLADVQGEFEIAPGTNGGTLVHLIVPVKNGQKAK